MATSFKAGAPGCCCAPPPPVAPGCVHVTGCSYSGSPLPAPAGTTVRVFSGSTTEFTATVNGSGVACGEIRFYGRILSITVTPPAGSGYATTTTSAIFSSSTPVPFAMAMATDWGCGPDCGCSGDGMFSAPPPYHLVPIPNTLHLTVGGQSITMTNSVGATTIWNGTGTFTANNAITFCPTSGAYVVGTNVPTPVGFGFRCISGVWGINMVIAVCSTYPCADPTNCSFLGSSIAGGDATGTCRPLSMTGTITDGAGVGYLAQFPAIGAFTITE